MVNFQISTSLVNHFSYYIDFHLEKSEIYLIDIFIQNLIYIPQLTQGVASLSRQCFRCYGSSTSTTELVTQSKGSQKQFVKESIQICFFKILFLKQVLCNKS